MASDKDFIEYIADQIHGAGIISYRKMLENTDYTATVKFSRWYATTACSLSRPLTADHLSENRLKLPPTRERNCIFSLKIKLMTGNG